MKKETKCNKKADVWWKCNAKRKVLEVRRKHCEQKQQRHLIVTKNNYKHTLRHHDWQLNRSVSADACTFAFPNHRFRCFCFAPLYLPRATRAATLSIFHQMSFCGVCISFAVFY